MHLNGPCGRFCRRDPVRPNQYIRPRTCGSLRSRGKNKFVKKSMEVICFLLSSIPASNCIKC